MELVERITTTSSGPSIAIDDMAYKNGNTFRLAIDGTRLDDLKVGEACVMKQHEVSKSRLKLM
jgi:hypothetical protein